MSNNISSLYIHIPFCKDRCIYCDFFSLKIENYINYLPSYIQALKTEFYLYKKYLSEKIKTIYIGGGTPSSIPSGQIKELLQFLKKNLSFSERYEFTFEMNPESVSYENLNILKENCVNRISLGIQSLSDIILKRLNRVHNKKMALTALEKIFNSNFINVGVDLLIGVSEETNGFLNDVSELLKYPLKHISAYILTYDDNKKKTLPKSIINIEDEIIESQYRGLHELLTKNNFHHYEISNYAIPGFESVHNYNYWRNGYYIGLGTSAAGHYKDKQNKIIRYKNTQDIKKYIRDLTGGSFCYEEYEEINRETDINETIMLSLRTSKGLSLNRLRSLLSSNEFASLLMRAIDLKNEGLIKISDKKIVCTLDGFLMNNKVARKIMF